MPSVRCHTHSSGLFSKTAIGRSPNHHIRPGRVGPRCGRGRVAAPPAGYPSLIPLPPSLIPLPPSLIPLPPSPPPQAPPSRWAGGGRGGRGGASGWDGGVMDGGGEARACGEGGEERGGRGDRTLRHAGPERSRELRYVDEQIRAASARAVHAYASLRCKFTAWVPGAFFFSHGGVLYEP